jgi:hypothetical protein
MSTPLRYKRAAPAASSKTINIDFAFEIVPTDGTKAAN